MAVATDTRDFCPDGANRKYTIVQLYAADPNSPIRIRFDRSSLEYSPGEEITGIVTVEGINKSFEIKEIKINVLGTGRTSWAISSANTKKQLSLAHASTESYIDTSFVVFSGGVDKFELGDLKEYPFSYILPSPPLPSTFIDAYGSITYVMKVKAITGTEQEVTCMGAFIVNGVYDLNTDYALNQKAELHDHKSVGFCWFKNGVVEIVVKLTHRGFLLGDRVTWRAEIDNRSKSRVKQVLARLVQNTLFHAESDFKLDSKVMTSVSAGSVEINRKEIWEGYLNLPMHLPPTTLGGCHLIVLNYGLEFELIIAGCTSNLKTEVPIAIGTVGLAKSGSGGKTDGTKEETISRFGRGTAATGELGVATTYDDRQFKTV